MGEKTRKRHNDIARKFKELNKLLDDHKYEYLEQISNNINKAIKNYNDKDLWKKSYDNIVDLFYQALTDTYLNTTLTLKDIYDHISDKIVNIEDFIYQDDDITLPRRIKIYWDEASSFLKKEQVDEKDIALHLLNMYDRILNNEMINVRTGVKRTKKPIDPDGISIVTITDGECCDNGGTYLDGEEPGLPPYHIGCQCDFWYDLYYPTDEADLEELQELGWEEEDG